VIHVNPWWGPPEWQGADDPNGVDAWFDVWADDEGHLVSYLGLQGSELPIPDLKAALERGLDELLAGRAKPWRQPPVDLDQPVLAVRVAHQRDGYVACGWGRFAAEDHLVRPLRALATIARSLLTTAEPERRPGPALSPRDTA
jgi:hypothetical protein